MMLKVSAVTVVNRIIILQQYWNNGWWSTLHDFIYFTYLWFSYCCDYCNTTAILYVN